jgi:hypothetical protein
MTKQLVEAAQRFPEIFGLSHDAGGDEQIIDGERRVVEMYEVKSVDVVADPATNEGLFESYQPASPMKSRMKRRAKRMAEMEIKSDILDPVSMRMQQKAKRMKAMSDLRNQK